MTDEAGESSGSCARAPARRYNSTTRVAMRSVNAREWDTTTMPAPHASAHAVRRAHTSACVTASSIVDISSQIR